MDRRRFRDYLSNLSDPKREQKGQRTFWSRAVRDNARAVADALIMDQEGVPHRMITLLTRTGNIPEGIVVDELYEILEEEAPSGSK